MIVLNKIDLVSPEHIAAVRRWLAAIKSEARVLLAKNSEIAPDVILGRHLDLRLQNGPRRMPWQGTEAYDTLEIAIDTPVDPEALSKALTDPRLGLLRAKGFVPGPDRNLVTLHVVGHRASVEPAPSWIDGPGRLVCIGLVKHMDRVAIVAAIRMAGACRPTDLQDQTDNSRS